MLNIALCDDENELLNVLKEMIISQFNINDIPISVDCYLSGESLLKTIESKEYDAIFLDVYMNGLSGFEVAEILAQRKYSSHIIFITSNSEFVYDSFDYQPFYFLRKSNYQTVLPRVVSKLIKSMKQNKLIVVENRDKQYSIKLESIIYIKSGDHYVLVNTGMQEYILRKKIATVEEELKDYEFIRVHRKYVVNLKYINKIDMSLNKIYLTDGLQIEMSRNYKNAVKDAHRLYLRRI